ncbi:hypothetical protein [Streptomyces griseoaurantiacus]|uniref:hypothetical protein n=1 Tax=Streptomyces griseoaurantiacus TaxID=68213 RepID=UPI0038041CB8
MTGLAPFPLPFSGDPGRWEYALRAADRLFWEAGTDLVVPERTRQGWLRWEVVADEQAQLHGRLREAGLLDPAQHRGWRWLCRAVRGHRPPTYIRTFGTLELPHPIPVGRAAVFAVTMLAALGPLTAVVPAPFRLLAAVAVGAVATAGLPALLQYVTRRRVRVVDSGAAYAPVFFRLLAGQQQLHGLVRRSGRHELARAEAILPVLLWDAAALVVLAGDSVEAREVLLGYEESLTLLVEQAVEVERQAEAVESAICAEPALPPLPVAGAGLPDGLTSRAWLDEAREQLEELGHGLRHAQDVLRGAQSDDTDNSMRKGEDHAR